MAKNPARGHKVEKHHPEGKNVPDTMYSPFKKENGYGTKILGKNDISKETKKKDETKTKNDLGSC